jgi:hypothetical protein
LYCLQDTEANNQSTTAVAGQTVTLLCHTGQQTVVDWWHQTSEGSAVQHVCMNGEIVVNFKPRFSLNTTQQGYHNLVISSVQMSDAGKYTCIEEAGMGVGRVSRLQVVQDKSTTTVAQSSGAQPKTTDGQSNDDGNDSKPGVVIAVVVIIGGFVAAAAIVIVILVVRSRRYPKKKDDMNNAEAQNLMSEIKKGLASRVHKITEFQAVASSKQSRSKIKLPVWRTTADILSESPDTPLTDCVPPELLRRILFQCIIQLAVSLMKKRPRTDIVALTTLGCVSSAWRHIILSQLRQRKSQLRCLFDRCCSPYLWRPKVKGMIWSVDDKMVIGVTHLNNEIYVAYQSSKQIKVYEDCVPYKPLASVNIECTNISDVVAWKMNESIFFGDLENHRIGRVNKDRCVSSWQRKIDARSLSAVADQLIVATKTKKLKVFDRDGVKLSSTKLVSDIDVNYMYALPKRHVTFCVRQKNDDKLGAKLKQSSSIERVFLQRFHLSFDKEGRGFFCDFDNKVIVLMTSDMQEQHVLLSSEYGGLLDPGKLCYVDELGELLVCDGTNVRSYCMRSINK